MPGREAGWAQRLEDWKPPLILGSPRLRVWWGLDLAPTSPDLPCVQVTKPTCPILPSPRKVPSPPPPPFAQAFINRSPGASSLAQHLRIERITELRLCSGHQAFSRGTRQTGARSLEPGTAGGGRTNQMSRFRYPHPCLRGRGAWPLSFCSSAIQLADMRRHLEQSKRRRQRAAAVAIVTTS